MSTLTVRPKIHVLTDYAKDPSLYTHREAMEWWKNCIKGIGGDAVTTAESNILNSRWAVLVTAIADREGVPPGYLSYSLGEMAQTEMRLGEVASAENDRAAEEARAALAAIRDEREAQ